LLAGCSSLLAAAVFSVFLDGYTFVMFGTTTIICGIVHHIGTSEKKTRQSQFALILVPPSCFAAAALLYSAYLPSDAEFPVQSLDYFRAMSIDLTTLAIPCSGLSWLWDTFGLSRPCDVDIFYGDRSSFSVNFLGYSSLFLALVGFFCRPRRRKMWVFLTLIATVSLLLAMGPSLKVNSFRADAEGEDHTRASYDMPAESAVLDLPTHQLFTLVPGLQNMRAVYRWLVVLKAVLLVFTLFGIRSLWTRFGWKIAFAASLILIIETVPDFGRRLALGRAGHSSIRYLRTKVIPSFSELVGDAEVGLFWRPGNDFFAHWAAPQMGLKVYNVGGDKNNAMAQMEWPAELALAISTGQKSGRSLNSLAQKGKLEVIIAPYFDMLWDVHRNWPISAEEIAGRRGQLLYWYYNSDMFRYFDLAESKFGAVLKPRLRDAAMLDEPGPPEFPLEQKKQLSPNNRYLIREGFQDQWWTNGKGLVSGFSYKIATERFIVLETWGWNPLGSDPTGLNLSISVGARELPLHHHEGLRYFFEIPEDLTEISELIIHSNTFVPKELGINNDLRTLGIDLKLITFE
jgi:hypothetical protein